MLTLPTLLKGFQRGDTNRLLRGLEAGGLPLPDALRPRLRDEPVVVLALLTRRATELAYGPCRELYHLADALQARQRPDGGFGDGSGPEPDPLATAAAYAALARLVDALPGAASLAAEHARDRAEVALKVALPSLLAELLDENPDDAKDPASSATCDTALAAFLLGDTPHLAEHLLSEVAIARLDTEAKRDAKLQSLWQMARLSLPAVHSSSQTVPPQTRVRDRSRPGVRSSS